MKFGMLIDDVLYRKTGIGEAQYSHKQYPKLIFLLHCWFWQSVYSNYLNHLVQIVSLHHQWGFLLNVEQLRKHTHPIYTSQLSPTFFSVYYFLLLFKTFAFLNETHGIYGTVLSTIVCTLLCISFILYQTVHTVLVFGIPVPTGSWHLLLLSSINASPTTPGLVLQHPRHSQLSPYLFSQWMPGQLIYVIARLIPPMVILLLSRILMAK